jgi:hypothetical protein
VRARMKPGHRPIVLDCMLVPEHPTYWTVPESLADGVALLVADGMVEYEPAFARGGAVPVPQLQQVLAAPARGPSKGKGRV